eukprot:TRINITY_DN36892_c0_g1_i1.p1 TRINITY_DN36892_c0_g1~~TRINITY_DN36892_c0_g1_i1.p1  ORF type:complete len:106 (+),score=4.85 TRINITY_DN36892_c0_g1_i1:184-501(+)
MLEKTLRAHSELFTHKGERCCCSSDNVYKPCRSPNQTVEVGGERENPLTNFSVPSVFLSQDSKVGRLPACCLLSMRRKLGDHGTTPFLLRAVATRSMIPSQFITK